MNAPVDSVDLDAVVSADTEDAGGYDAWFRAQVLRAMADTSPTIAHDDLVAELDAMIADIESELVA